ncbi:RDD family protein [Dermatophilus congolensis]|uniref:RDD family protein n=1 Tax=Dermatophilus congolensis TaxID=1863 RepID=UPI001AAE43AE|nr:RDD family protein [Dermatophilus congolensis]MBO3142516.1 RDD family protein [Dermatophilus congolensis]MBO3151506.1 RDD family protein [Dermatophilus congolensis]MBO3161492.1 RDD family protein [Dermatophilus congolensis]MBO3162791.1 RDD family protein [Dermatophilus congolensis]MBO3176345.1 RDD family protein [Dermatophilus congolensis]
MDARPSGWYDDPDDPDLLRYWDGVLWTEHTALRRPPQNRTDQPPTTPVTQPTTFPLNPPGGNGMLTASGAWRGMGIIAADGHELAHWWRRAVAYIIDVFVLAAIALPFLYAPISAALPQLQAWVERTVAVAQQGGTTPPEMPQELLSALASASLMLVLIRLTYEVVTVRQWGGGVGKLLLGLRVRGYGHTGTLGWAPALRRAVIKNIYSMVGGLPLLGALALGFQVASFAWPLWDKQRQALHDKIATTEVIRITRGTQQW